MNNLEGFEAPRDGELTLCQVNERLHSTNAEFANVSAFTNAVDKHPTIKISRDMLHMSKSLEDGKDLFLPVHVSFLKHLIQIYYEHGLTDALETLSQSRKFPLSYMAQMILLASEKMTRLRAVFDPTISESNDHVINRLSQTRKWLQAPVRCMAWHPTVTKIAVAALDDTVRIFTDDCSLVPILKCRQQKNVSCMAWRYMSHSDLAVACESGVIVWNIEASSTVMRPSTNHAVILYQINHTPVTGLSWSPRGDILATVSVHDSKILLWDVEMERNSALKRGSSTAYSLVKWSPSGDRLFASTASYVFRVWDCVKWNAERWNIAAGYVQTACWSSDGKHLLFSTSEEPIIYALSFANFEIFSTDTESSPQEAIPLYDVGKVEVNGVVVGGLVQCLEWSSTGNHVAALFQDTNYVAVFNVVACPVLQLLPGFLIAGQPEELPNVISFQRNFNQGSCLSIAWSSGRVQHFPIVYTNLSSKNPSVDGVDDNFVILDTTAP